MSRTRYVLQCPGCAAPVADSLRQCPYCARPVRADALGPGVTTTAPGKVVVHGTHVEVGAEAGAVRACPFCGASTAAAERRCAHCQAKLVIETMYLRTLVIERSGSMTVHAGAKVIIGRPGPAPRLSQAAKAGDLAKVKERVNAGDEVDATDASLKTPLLLALEAGALDVARYLLSMGANVADASAEGLTPLHVAAARGADEVVDALLAEGADANAKTQAKETPADAAAKASHAPLAERLRARTKGKKSGHSPR